MQKSKKQAARPTSRRKSETVSHRDFSSSEKPASWKGIALALLAIILLNLYIYAPSLNFDFLHFDDQIYVTENAGIARGFSWAGFMWAFNVGYAANWHPLTWLSHMLDVQLYGMAGAYHHITNVLLHILNSLLLFWLLCRTTRAWRPSVMVALLFAVHPLHVESVAWIAERKDVLSTLFWMLTFHAYVSYVRRPLRRRYLAVLGLFCLGLMAKPMLVTLPLVLLLFDIWPLGRVSLESGQRRVWLKLLVEKIPLFALSAVSSVFTVLAQSRGGAVQNFEMLSLSQRAANAVVSYFMYIAQMLWPVNLIAYYHYEPPAVWIVAVGIVVLGAVSGLALRIAKRHPFLLVGWIWYLCTLLPVIGLVQVGAQSRADRYTYVPLIGLFIIAGWGIPKLLAARRDLEIGLGVTAAIVICALTAVARNQVRYWENDLILWEHAVRVEPDNSFARINYGTALDVRGESAAAVDQYKEALRIKPNSAESHNGLATALSKIGLWSEAAYHYQEALQIRPDFTDAHVNLGTLWGSMGRTEEAITEFLAALKLEPQKAEIHFNLGFALARQGKMDEAATQYREALDINPLYAEALTELGNISLLRGDMGSAMSYYSKSLEINPELANTHINLGLVLMYQKRSTEAISHFNEALRINPNSMEARRNLELALQSK
jgi:protein O-mannosyl-transferase